MMSNLVAKQTELSPKYCLKYLCISFDVRVTDNHLNLMVYFNLTVSENLYCINCLRLFI